MALVGETAPDDRIRLEPFLDDEIVGIALPGTLNLNAGRVKPRELAQHTMLVRSAGSSTRRIAEATLARAGACAATTWELDSSEAIKRAARAGLGYSFLSRYAVIEEIERGDLEVFRLVGAPAMKRTPLHGAPGAPPAVAEREGLPCDPHALLSQRRGVRCRLPCPLARAVRRAGELGALTSRSTSGTNGSHEPLVSRADRSVASTYGRNSARSSW